MGTCLPACNTKYRSEFSLTTVCNKFSCINMNRTGNRRHHHHCHYHHIVINDYYSVSECFHCPSIHPSIHMHLHYGKYECSMEIEDGNDELMVVVVMGTVR